MKDKPKLTLEQTEALYMHLRAVSGIITHCDPESLPYWSSRSWEKAAFWASRCADMLQGETEDEV
jgi:hypothetical protein